MTMHEQPKTRPGAVSAKWHRGVILHLAEMEVFLWAFSTKKRNDLFERTNISPMPLTGFDGCSEALDPD